MAQYYHSWMDDTGKNIFIGDERKFGLDGKLRDIKRYIFRNKVCREASRIY